MAYNGVCSREGGDDVDTIDALEELLELATTGNKVIFGTSDSSLYHVVDADTGKAVLQSQDKAYIFSSPAVAGDVVFLGVLNGTLEARDLATGNILWEFHTEASKRNSGWVLTADRRFNMPMIYRSNWHQAPLMASDRQFSIGSIFSSPLVVDGAVYFGSTDGNLYAIE